MIAELAAYLPVEWKGDSFVFRGQTYPSDSHVPVLVFPNPLNPNRYVVLNSGLTFREGHDKTNSQQNPKLPDWAVIGLDRDPDAFAPGRVAAAGRRQGVGVGGGVGVAVGATTCGAVGWRESVEGVALSRVGGAG
mgnify:CR=1 FL=1